MKKFDLKDIVETLDAMPNEYTAYLNIHSGEVRNFSEEQMFTAEEGETDELADWEADEIERAREVLEDEDEEWKTLPTKYEINDWEIMRSFIDEQSNNEQRDELLQAISGRGAFRMFRIIIERIGLLDKWYAFKADYYGRIILDWMEQNGINPDEEQQEV